ncbi:MAG: carbohydrate kinase [Burkholderiales bacterium]
MLMICGEALLDVFQGDATRTGMALDANVGGSPFNLAVGLARLGQPAALFTAISTGFAGERLMRTLVDEGVDTQAVARLGAPTTLSLIGLDALGVPSYAFYGDGCADRLVTTEDLKRVPAELTLVNLGSYATVVEPVAAMQRALVERERARGAAGALIAYDPNIRLNVEPDLARWRAQLDWMLPRTDLLKVSEEDLALMQSGTSLDDFATNALVRGVKLVVVTRGAQGAIGWNAQGRVGIDPVKVTVIDTVGAGDTFQAALITWLAEHGALSAPALPGLTPAQLHDALGFAARAAAITCSRRGADMPRRAEVN